MAEYEVSNFQWKDVPRQIETTWEIEHPLGSHFLFATIWMKNITEVPICSCICNIDSGSMQQLNVVITREDCLMLWMGHHNTILIVCHKKREPFTLLKYFFLASHIEMAKKKC